MRSRYEIAAGTVVLVNQGGTGWTMHTTKRHLAFERCESISGGFYIFRQDEWLVRVLVSRVWRRDVGLETYRQLLDGMRMDREYLEIVRGF